MNAIGLAESEDLLRWKKHPGNPVMHHPDARWYEGATQDGMRGGISCRDVSVIEDAFTDEWVYACFTASTGRGDYYRRGCIGLARSKNLIDWEYLPPLFAPGLYTAMEVPRVCRIGSQVVSDLASCSLVRTPHRRGLWPAGLYRGETMIHYAVADKPLGPYRLPDDPTLFRGCMPAPMSSTWCMTPARGAGDDHHVQTTGRKVRRSRAMRADAGHAHPPGQR